MENLLTYKNPTGTFFWTGTVKDPECVLGSRKVGCPHKTTREEAEKLISGLCKAYPNSVFCLDKCPKGQDQTPKIGLIVDEEGHGVGVVTPKGVKTLPSVVPHPLPQISHEAGTVPIVTSLEEGDGEQLVTQVKSKVKVEPTLDEEVISVEELPKVTKREENDLLAQIRKGIELKKISPESSNDSSLQGPSSSKGPSSRCTTGFYWSQKLGRCIAIVTDEADQQSYIAEALRRKFAQALPSYENEI